MTDEPIEVRRERREATVILTLDRPGRKNAWTPRMARQLYGAIAEADRDPGVRAIVVTGAGGAFCAGADLADGAETFARPGFASYDELERAVVPWRLRTPIIAAIDGPAVGVGATVPLLFDLRIASERARIGFVFVRRGIVPEANSSWILPRIVGMSRALDLLLTGRIVDAREALDLGLVSRVVPPERLLDEALAVGDDLARHTSPLAVAMTKRLVWAQLSETDPASAKRREDAVFRWIGRQPDAAEGVRSFLEKRPPRWADVDIPAEIPDDTG